MPDIIFLPDRFHRSKNYTAKGKPVSWTAPPRDRVGHGNRLQGRIAQAWADIDQRYANPPKAVGLSHPEGAHISFRLKKGSAQKVKSLEKLGGIEIRIRHQYTDTMNGEEFIVAVLWVPKERRSHFSDKLQAYLTEETRKGNPKNNDLITCIEDIRAALLSDFWPKEEQDRIPEEADWVEAWVATEDRSDNANQEAVSRFQQTCVALDIHVGARQLVFPERRVLLIHANKSQLQTLVESSAELAELRLARPCVDFFVRESDVQHWIDDLTKRTQPPPANAPAVCVFDTGVNSGHRLLKPVCDSGDCLTVIPSWGSHDHHGHGSRMAGLAAYGSLELPLADAGTVQLTHRIESVKLLGPVGHRETLPKDLWGDYTQRAASEIETAQPDRNRVLCMSITSTEDKDMGRPSSWSGAIDQLTSGQIDDFRRLMLISAGNVTEDEFLAYPDSNATAGIEDPGQAWNAITVGAYTEKTKFTNDGSLDGYKPIAPSGALSPYSKTTLVDWDKTWPLKPEIVCEGGNYLKNDKLIQDHADLECLTTSQQDTVKPLSTMWGTSGAVALASRLAAQIQAHYPDAWPETIRALLIHSARWTRAMVVNHRPNSNKSGFRSLLQTVGYGVPDLKRAVECGKSSLTLVSEQEIQPYGYKTKNGRQTTETKTNEMHVFELPWPVKALQDLPPHALVNVRVTLSYFIEPSPQEIGWKDRYRYPSHGLRWDMQRSAEPRSDFLSRITEAIASEEDGLDVDDEAVRPGGSDKRWRIGLNTRSRGSIHSDLWEQATAAEVASCNFIAVYPTMGWWRLRKHLGYVERKARYSLVVSIEAPDQDVDIYSPVAAQVRIPIVPTVVT